MVLMLAGSGARAASSPTFKVPTLHREAGTLPRDLATADFNLDGAQDVAVANLGPDAFKGGITVLLGNGGGELGTEVTTGLGTNNGASQAAVGEFDGDGKPDVAVLTGTTGGPGPVRILLGKGNGGFTLGQQLSTTGSGTVLSAELTGDTKQDVVFVSGSVAQVKLFTGVGNGTFSGPTTFNQTWDAYDAELADADGDGDLDIIGASGGPVWIMLNLGGGSFGQQVYQFADDLSGWQLAAADFNGDAKADVAVLDASGGHVQIGLGTGDGHMQPYKVYSDVSFQTSEVAAADWTGDGKVDLVVNNEYSSPSNIAVLMKGKGTGAFSGFTYWTTGNQDPTPVELNGDGRIDLVAFSEDPGQVYATLNAGRGRLLAPQSTLGKAIGTPTSGDVNGDGRTDLVMVAEVLPGPGQLEANVFTHLGQAGGRFGSAIVSAIRDVETMEGAGEVALGDVDEDGALDLVVGAVHLYPKPSNLWVMLGDGTGSFAGLQEFSTGDSWTSNESIGLADVTGDGHLDVIGRNGSQIAVLPGTGTGSFGPAILSGSVTSGLTQILVSDFTGDGTLDLVLVIRTGGEDFGSGELRLHEGHGNSTFTFVQTVAFDGNPGGAQVADLNGDGRSEVAVTGTMGSNGGRTGLRVSLNSGSRLGAITFYPFAPYPYGDLDAADYDLDGDIDLAGSGLDALAIALNAGDGTFPAVAEYVSPQSAVRLAGDFTGDERPDLLSMNATNKPLFSLYVNTTGG
jgi:hypothetical protein